MMQVDTVLVCAQPKHIAVAIEGARVIPVQLTDQVGIVLMSLTLKQAIAQHKKA